MWQRSALIALCAVLLAACSGSDDRFVETYTDILVVRMSQRDSTDGNRQVQDVLAKHGYSEEAFRREFIERARDPERLRTLLDTARARALRHVELKAKLQQSNRQR
ncbi:hypothetical protein HRbin20_00685 [bacterium HR20]|nr:hypothetical protein HRbin20_00685 [bacterium HR20]